MWEDINPITYLQNQGVLRLPWDYEQKGGVSAGANYRARHVYTPPVYGVLTSTHQQDLSTVLTWIRMMQTWKCKVFDSPVYKNSPDYYRDSRCGDIDWEQSGYYHLYLCKPCVRWLFTGKDPQGNLHPRLVKLL